MKKHLLFVISIIMIMSLTIVAFGCGEKKEDNGNADPETPETYTVTVEGGISNKTEFTMDEMATVTAVVPAGQRFVAWKIGGDSVSSMTTYSFSVTGNVTIVAVCEDIPTFTISATNGTVNGKASDTIQEGASVTVVATIPVGKKFVNWTKDSDNSVYSVQASCPITVTADVAITAHFEDLEIYTITIADGIGTLTGGINGGNTFYEGTKATLTANPPEGKVLDAWTSEGKNISGAKVYTFTVTASKSIDATWKDPTPLTTPTAKDFNTKADGANGISLEIDRDGHDLFSNPNLDYIKILIYTSNAADAVPVGECKLWEYEVTSMDGTWTLAHDGPNGENGYEYNGPNNYYIFGVDAQDIPAGVLGEDYNPVQEYWLAIQQIAKKTSDYVDSAVGPKTANAYQEKSGYTINVVGGYGGTTAKIGQEVTITPIIFDVENPFVNWTVGTDVLSTDASYTFVPTKDMEIKANYANPIVKQEFRALKDNYLGVEGGGATQYDRGDDKNLFDNPYIDYVLVHVYDSKDADAVAIGTYKYYKNEVSTMSGAATCTVNGYPTNGYITADPFKTFIMDVLGASYSDATKYYFKSQVIVITNDYFTNGALSGFTSRGWINGKGEA